MLFVFARNKSQIHYIILYYIKILPGNLYVILFCILFYYSNTMILLFYSSSHMAFTAQVLDSVSEMVDFQAVPHFFPHSSTAPWSGVCSQSCWPRIFNVFLFGSLDDLIVSKLGLWVVTLKLAPNAAWYYFGCLLSLALSLSLTHTHAFYIFISMCFHFLQRRRQTCFFWMFCRCKAGSVVAIWKSACRPGMEN